MLSKETTNISENISLLLSIILSSIHIDLIKKIYLFGSYSYGKPNFDSDYDICVIIDEQCNKRDIYIQIMNNLLDNNIYKCDLLVKKENIFLKKINDNKNSIESIIFSKGTILYEK